MRIQARQSILDMWQAATDYSFAKENTWEWGGRTAPNCIADAEQLLVLLYPATTIASLRLEATSEIPDDVRRALARLGRSQPIPLAVLRGVREYLLRYRDREGCPTFAGGSYFRFEGEENETTARQRELDVVEAYSRSITLSLAVIGFAKVYRATLTRPGVMQEVAEVESLASERLSAAMVGLLRSFNVHTFDPDSDSGQALLAMVNQADASPQATISDLSSELDELWVGLSEGLAEGLDESQRQLFDDFAYSERLFECGWSWGVLDGASRVHYADGLVPHQPEGVAEARPYLYFTITAMDSIEDLLSERTRVLGLLTVEQQRLARALQNRSNLTRQYWARLATFGTGRWPLEDVPWRTTDGSESDYNSLFLAAVVAQELADQRGAVPKLRRLAQLLSELASRAKITRRPVSGDPAVGLHLPGMTISLRGSEKAGDEAAEWVVSTFSVVLLKQVVQLARLVDERVERNDLLQLADQIWIHLQRRRLGGGAGRELWDSPEALFGGYAPGVVTTDTSPSWHHTERAMEALVQAAVLVDSDALASNPLSSLAEQILAEAENLLDREILRQDHEASGVFRERFRPVQAALRRSRELLASRPATAAALAHQALISLDELVAAREGARRL